MSDEYVIHSHLPAHPFNVYGFNIYNSVIQNKVK